MKKNNLKPGDRLIMSGYLFTALSVNNYLLCNIFQIHAITKIKIQKAKTKKNRSYASLVA